MADPNYYELYKALKADGAVQGDWASFHQYVGAKGKQGYENRLNLYKALKADGAIQSKSYEEFQTKLFNGGQQSLKAAKQRQEPQTAAQRALQMIGSDKPVVDYVRRPSENNTDVQQPKPLKGPGKNASALVRGLYQQDDEKRTLNSVPYMPKQDNGDSAFVQNMKANDKVTDMFMKDGAPKTIVRDTLNDKPMVDTGYEGANLYVTKTRNQFADEISQSGRSIVDGSKAADDFVENMVNQEVFKADQRYRDILKNGAGAGSYMSYGMNVKPAFQGLANKEVDDETMLKNLEKGLTDSVINYISNPNIAEQIRTESKRLGVDPIEYVKGAIAPVLYEKMAQRLPEETLKKYLPQSRLEYLLDGINDSALGTLTIQDRTKGQRMKRQEATEMTREGDNPYFHATMWDNAGRGAVSYAADYPLFRAAGPLASSAVNAVFGSTAKQAIRAANQTLMQRIGTGVVRGVIHGGVTGFQYGAVNNVIQNYSTGEDTSLGGTLKAALKGGVSEAVSFATMEGMGGVVGAFGRGMGLTGAERTFGQKAAGIGKKLTFETVKTGMEGIGMATGGVASDKVASWIEGRDSNGFTTEGTLESCASAVVFKLMHAKEAFKSHGGGAKKGNDESGNVAKRYLDKVKGNLYGMFLSENTRSELNGQVFSKSEMWQLRNAGEKAGMDVSGTFVGFADKTKKPTRQGDGSNEAATYYQAIMNDPTISWDTKAKFTTMVMGTMPSARPLADYVTFTTEKLGGNEAGYEKYINEYSADGKLLSKTSYDSISERRAEEYEIKAKRADQVMWNALGVVVGQDMNETNLQNGFFKKQLEENDYYEDDVDTLVYGMGQQGSAEYNAYKEYVTQNGRMASLLQGVAERHGMTVEDVYKALQKEHMKRTDSEQKAMVDLRKTAIEAAFSKDKVHEEQSRQDGKDVAEENGLGTDKPNPQAVTQELNNLKQAEAELEAMMRGDDTFAENFKNLQGQGLTTPQIYEWMINNGLTEEQLAPFARYINAVSRVQGMQKATSQAIDQHVQAFVTDWTYHGEMNGEKQDGDSALWVQDKDGRALLVGSGDVSYDANDGHCKDGDMLVCFDPNTGEVVYMKASDTTLMQTQTKDELAADERRRIENINNAPYQQAAQEQAAEEAAKAQQQGGEKPADTTAEDKTGQKQAPQSAAGGTTPAPQQETKPARKFADGSDVPMTKDSKGRDVPDYDNMTVEQAAELLSQDFGESAEKVAEGMASKAQKELEKAQKMKVDYEGDVNDIKEQEGTKQKAIDAAKKKMEHADGIKKALTAKKVEKTVEDNKTSSGGANEADPAVKKRFDDSKKITGRRGSITLANGQKITGTYVYGETSGLTPSHDPTNNFAQSEGFPVNADGTSANSRSYKDAHARAFTIGIGNDFNGLAVQNVPVVQDGVVLSGNGTTMAKRLAEQNGKDGRYYESLAENAGSFGLSAEDIEKAGFKGLVYFVPDEKMPLTSDTFDIFNKRTEKNEGNKDTAVKLSKTLSAEDVGAIIAEIEGKDGSGTLEAFFNNPSAINDLMRTLMKKGIIGQNEVGALMEGENKLSPQGRDFVKNLLLGSTFSPETIEMMGEGSSLKDRVVKAIRPVLRNMKLGVYSLKDEIDEAVRLMCEARTAEMTVDNLLRQGDFVKGNARDRYPSISQLMALTLEGKVDDFRNLLDDYNRQAAAHNTGEADVFGDAPTKEELIKEFLDYKKWKDYDKRGKDSEGEGGNDVQGLQESQPEASGGDGEREPLEGGQQPSEAEKQKKVNDVLKALAKDITEKAVGAADVVTDSVEAERIIREAEFNNNPLKFQIKTPEQRKAAENAYNWAAKFRPDKYSRYVIVNMDRPNAIPEYFERKKVGDQWRRYYNKLRWGNYKLFDLGKSFDENVDGLKGPFPDDFDSYRELKHHRANAGGRVLGMKKLPKNLQIDPDYFYNQAVGYHSDKWDKLFHGQPEDSVITYLSPHDGKWYFYSVDNNTRDINIFDAVIANKENYDKFKELYERYGFNKQPGVVHGGMQETGDSVGTSGDLYESFLRGGLTRDTGLRKEALKGDGDNYAIRVDEPDGDYRVKMRSKGKRETSKSIDAAYFQEVKKAQETGDWSMVNKMVLDKANEQLNEMLLPNDNDEEGFKYHRGAAPKKTFKRYAVLNVTPEGFKAAYAGNKSGTPVGVWLDAQNLKAYLSDIVQFADGSFASYIPGDTGATWKGKFTPETMAKMVADGVKKSTRWLLERGGKHSSDVPNFSQMNVYENEKGEKVSSAKDGALPHNKLIFEIEYGMSEDGDLTDYVKEHGRIDKAGKNQGLAKIDPNQYYDFKTNPNAVGKWGIGGTFRIVRLVPHDEIIRKTEQYKSDTKVEAKRALDTGEITKDDYKKIIENADALSVQKWVGGYHPEDFGLDVESVAKMAEQGKKRKLTDPVTYDDNGNIIPLSSRFNMEKEDLRYFKTKDGEVYGFTDGKKIYLDLKKMKADTPLHEYGHLWVAALQRLNPKEWENVKGLFDQVEGLKEEIQKAYPELKGDDLYEEMITTYSGRKGAEKLEAEAKRIAADEGKELEDSAKAKGFVDKVRDALKRYWKGVADLLGIKFTNADEVADKILADWADGVDPRKLEGKKEEDSFASFKEDSPEEGVVEKDRKTMTAFAEKAVGLDNAVTDDYDTYGAKRTSVDVQADKLYGKERKWLSGKEAVAWHDDENRCSYELIPHRDRQGHLKSVTVVKYHGFGGGEEKVYTDVDGNPIVVKRDDGSVEMNLATWADEKEQVRNALEDGGIEPEYVDAMMAQADQVAAALADLTEKYPAFKAMQEAGATGRPILRNTGEYISWDYSFNCIKKDALNAVMDLVVAEGKSDHLGITQVEALKKVLQRHGFLTPCVMCYVEAKRKVYKQSKEMAVKWNAVAEAAGLPKDWMGKDMDLSEDQRGALGNLADGKGLERVEGYQPNRSGDGIKADTIRKIAGLMLGSPKLRGRMDYAWMMSPGSFTEMYTKFGGTGLMEFMTQGQSRGKSLLEASPFSMNDIPRDLMLEMYNPVKLAELGGLRQFSYEDARALMFFDYYQQFLLMQGARAPEHLYTKRPFMPEMFGRTGAMMNQSLVVDIWPGDDWHRKALGLSEEEYEGWLDSHAGFVPKGALPKDDARYAEGSTELVPNWSVESFPVDIAMKNVHNRNFRGCVGNVVVAPNREFILWALDNPDIHQILAYHATGANPVMRSLTGYDRVKGMDDGYHTLDRNGKAVNELYVPDIGLRIEGKGLRWNTLLRRNGYDARRAAQVYLDYCKENGMTPMFCYEGIVDMSGEKAVSHPEYYKLLTDFRMYDEDGRSVRQRAVKAVLPEDWHGILERYLQEEQVGSDAVKGIRLDGGLLKEVHDVTRYVSMEPSERDAFMGLLGDIYGKDKVSVLRTKEFDATLDAATDDGRSELLRDKGGMVYGFTDGERIVLNEDVFNAHTPMHEHTHIFMKVLQAVNPRLYERGMELWRDSPLWKKAKAGLEALGEAATDDQVFSECISQFAGQENEKVISRVTGITDKGWLRKAMDWMKAMWAGVKSAFSRWTGKDLDGLTAEEFGRMPLRAVYDEKERKAYTERVRQYAEMSGKAEGNVELHADRGSGKKDEAAERRRRAGLEAAVDKIRKAGIDVSTDWKEGQRVLDMANGKDVRMMAFGEPYDYERYPLGRVEPGLEDKKVDVVEANANHGFVNYKEAKTWAKQNIVKVYGNVETGGKGIVRISNAAIDKYMSQSAIDKSDSKDIHMAVLKVLPDVLKSSIDVETHPDFLKGKDGKRSSENGINKDVIVHRCYGAVNVGGKVYRVKLTLKEDGRNNRLPHNIHSYEATKIELSEGTLVKPEGDNPNTNNSITGAKLLKNVEMSYDKGRKLLDESKKMSDVIREQKVFDEKDLKITDRVRFFRTKDGEAYGFTVGGKIYIDPRIASAETAVHEYAHLLGTALKEGNPEEWKNVVKLMKDTPVWNEVREGYPELETDDEVADEVLATYSGRKGGERIDAAINEAANGDGTMLEKAAAVSALQRVKAALKRFWKGVADFLGIHFTSADDVADTVMSNFMESVNPQEALKKKGVAEGVDAGRVTDDGGKVRFSFGDDSMRGKPRRKKGESMASYVRRVRDWQHDKWVSENDPRPEMPLVDNETLDLEYGKYTRDWNKRHGLPEDYSDMGMPVRAEGESDDDYLNRIKLHERFVKERETEGDRFEEMIGFVPKAVVEYKKAVQEWEIRREQENAARAGDVLAELEKKAPKTDEASALLDYADEKAMAALGAAVGVSTDAKGAAWSTKMAIINRRKDLESMNAEDAIYLYNLRKQMEGVAASMGITAEELDGQLPGIIELPHMIANAEGNFERAKLGQEAEPIAVAKEYLDHLQKRKKELDGNTQLQQLLCDVKRWYDEAYLLMENAGLRGDAGYVSEGYVNHVWDAAKSDAKAYDNYVRTRSGNMKHRELMTYDEGQELGLVPKFEKLTDMMAYYSRQNNQAVSNKRLLDALSRTNVQKINDDGEVIGEFPLISSVEPDFALNGEYERLEVPGIGGVWVYKPAKTTFESVFGNLRTAGIPGWMTKAARVYDKGSGTVKKWQLSFSAFHMGALIEVGAAQMGPVRVLQALGKYIVEDSFKNGTVPAYAHPEDFKDAAKHLVKLGATDDYAAADVQAMTEQLKNWADKEFGKGGVPSTVAAWLDFANKGLDKVLWTYIHDGLKMACFKMLKEQVMRDAAKKGWSEEKTEKMLDEAGQLVNDTFGGQYWEVIGMTPSQVKWMRRLFLSPDWLISTQRHFLANFGFGSIYSQEGFADYVKEFGKDLLHGRKPKMNDYRWLRSKAALTCYLLGMCFFLYPMFNGVNACSRYRDEQQEKAKADEIRKTNPDYKSPYELAYPDGMKWWQYTMLGNASGQQTHLFMGRYKDGTEWYARWGKQFREFPELFIGPEGFDFPTPMLNRMMGKANPVLAWMRDGLGCLGVSGFKVSDPETADIIDRYGRKVAFLAMTAQHLLPFSVPTQSDKEWKWLDIVMPSSKGFSRYKAVKGFETMIVSGDMDGVAAVYRSAVMNHIDAEKCLKAAIANVEAEQRRALKDGVKDLRGAMEGFDGAKTLEEKKVMRMKILGYMTADSEKYRQFSLEEARETASMAIDGTIADAEKDNDRYLMRATSEDMRDDWKLTAVMKRTSAVEKRYREIREDEGMTDAQKEAWMEQNGKWLQARKMVQKCRSAMTKMKRGLGKGDDASLMERIREVRKRTMEELDGLDKRP